MKTVTLKKDTTATKISNLNQKRNVKELDAEIDAYYRKLKSLRCKYGNSLNVCPNEAKYLLSGHCTELIDVISIRERKYTEDDDNNFNKQPHEYLAKIYGAVAANKSDGRYCYIYLHFEWFVIKCWNLKSAYDLIPTFKECCEVNDKIDKLYKERSKIYKREKRLSQNSTLASKTA